MNKFLFFSILGCLFLSLIFCSALLVYSLSHVQVIRMCEIHASYSSYDSYYGGNVRKPFDREFFVSCLEDNFLSKSYAAFYLLSN